MSSSCLRSLVPLSLLAVLGWGSGGCTSSHHPPYAVCDDLAGEDLCVAEPGCSWAERVDCVPAACRPVQSRCDDSGEDVEQVLVVCREVGHLLCVDLGVRPEPLAP